jgi:type II secretory pathway component PulF
MNRYRFRSGCILTILGCLWMGFLAAWATMLGGFGGIPFALLLSVPYVWVVFAFFHYRQCRQDEFLHLLTTAVEAQAPLAPALRAYVVDRPNGPLREAWVATLLFFLLPGYYWLWYRRFSFDRKVVQVAGLLDMGYSLPEALYASPGVMPRQTVLAATVGESTGRLAHCLRQSVQTRLAPLWLEVLPRIAYPFLLLFFISGVWQFWMILVAPKFEQIFREFRVDLPEATERLFAFADWLADDGWLITLIVPASAVVVLILFLGSTCRWYCPVVGGFYRRIVQSRVLRMLGVLLETGKPVPEALGILADSGYFPRVAERRLDAVRLRVEHGEPLADSLRRGRLLPPAMMPLVQAAERVGNLPWVLSELSMSLANGTIRRLRRLSIVIGPLVLIAIGSLVAFLALGMFWPLIELLTRLNQ